MYESTFTAYAPPKPTRDQRAAGVQDRVAPTAAEITAAMDLGDEAHSAHAPVLAHLVETLAQELCNDEHRAVTVTVSGEHDPSPETGSHRIEVDVAMVRTDDDPNPASS